MFLTALRACQTSLSSDQQLHCILGGSGKYVDRFTMNLLLVIVMMLVLKGLMYWNMQCWIAKMLTVHTRCVCELKAPVGCCVI